MATHRCGLKISRNACGATGRSPLTVRLWEEPIRELRHDDVRERLRDEVRDFGMMSGSDHPGALDGRQVLSVPIDRGGGLDFLQCRFPSRAARVWKRCRRPRASDITQQTAAKTPARWLR